MSSPILVEQLHADRALMRRMFFVAYVVVLLFMGVFWRLYHLQIQEKAALSVEAAKKYRHKQTLNAQRGSLKDQQGRFLAYDEEIFQVITDKYHLNDTRLLLPALALMTKVKEKELNRLYSGLEIIQKYKEEVARRMVNVIPLTEKILLEKLNSSRHAEELVGDLGEEQAKAINVYIKENNMRGIYVRSVMKRHYATEDRMSLIVGGMVDGKGEYGIEARMNEELAGHSGWIEVEFDKYGNEVANYQGELLRPEHGKNVHLTIDIQIQTAVDAILDKYQDIYKPTKMMAVIVEVKTGNVVAMSFLPAHQRATGVENNWKNLTISEPYEPGSTFKIVTFTAALDHKCVSPTDRFFCEGGDYTDPVLNVSLSDDESLGSLPVRTIFAHSSNIGTYKIFKTVGKELFIDCVKRFGFGSKTQIILTGESAGYINNKKWSNTTYSRFPIGYEVNVTPLQVALAYASLGNKGKLMKPRLISAIYDTEKKEFAEKKPEVAQQVCSERTAAQMLDFLEAVVNEGTGKRAKIEGVRVGGKTGTSRRYDPEKRGYVDGQYVTSFAGLAPIEDPRLACVVVVDNPKASSPGEIRGGRVAAPIFAEILAETLKRLAARPEQAILRE